MGFIYRDPEVEILIDKFPDGKDVYRFMREQFDEFDGVYEPYDVEVARLASKTFNISIDNAIRLYSDIETKIAEFHIERYKKEVNV